MRLTLDAIAFRAIQWGREILSATEGATSQRMEARLRIALLLKSDSRALVSTSPLSLSVESQIFPFDFERRRALIVRFSLFGYLPFPDWLKIIRLRESTFPTAQEDFEAAYCSNIRRLVDTWRGKDSLLQRRQAAAIATEPGGGRRTSPTLTSNAALEAQTFRVKDIDNSVAPNRRREMLGELALPADCNRTGPGSNIKYMSKNAADTDTINRFRDAGVAMDITRQSIDSLPIFTAWIPFYADCCDLARAPYAPPTADRVRRCGRRFITGKSLSIYAAISRWTSEPEI